MIHTKKENRPKDGQTTALFLNIYLDKIYNISTLSTLSTLSTQSTPNIHQHAHQREYILIDTKIVKIGYPQAELGQEGHLTLLDLM